MSKPLVSICIPTFNRCEYLTNTLNSIVVQPEFRDQRVEVVISDNASEDKTPEVCAEYCRQYPNVHYHRNVRNVRDENFPLALQKANGILRKLNNDTYVLDQGILSVLCHLVEEYKTSRPLLFFTDANRKNTANGIIPFREFVEQTGYMVTWLGGFSIWEDECEGTEGDRDACGLHLWQVKKAYELGNRKDACVIYGGRLGETQQVPGKDISYGVYEIFYKNYLSLLKPYVLNQSLPSETYETIRKDLLYNFFTDSILNWELQRNEMKYSEENFKKAVFDAYKNEPYWDAYQTFYNKKLRKRKIKLFFKNLFGGR